MHIEPLEMTPEFASVVGRPRMRVLLERVELCHLESAQIMRAHGRGEAARRAELSAARVRMVLDEPRRIGRLSALAARIAEAPDVRAVVELALEDAVSLTAADFGNVQVCKPGSRVLRIAADSGFDSDFLDHFAVVDDASSACGRAAQDRIQTVISDTRSDPRFAAHREVARASGFQAVQSTPVVDADGRLRGVISTHFARTHAPDRADMQVLQWYAEGVGSALAAHMAAPATLEDAIASLAERAAALSAGSFKRAA